MGEKTAGVGHYAIPTAPIRGVTVTSGITNAFGSYAQIVASTSEAIFINGLYIAEAQTGPSYYAVQIGVGVAGSESIVEIKYAADMAVAANFGYMPIIPPVPVAASSRIAVATAIDGGIAKTCKITLDVIAQSNVVDDGVAGTATVSGTVAANMTQVNGHSVTDTANGVLDVNAKNHGGTAQTGRDIGASVLVGDKTGFSLTQAFPSNFSAMVISAAGAVDSNLKSILGTVLTETAGQIAAAFKQFFNIASPTSTMNTITTVTTATTATNLTNAPASGDLTATMKTSVTTAATAATPTAAAVTGAVGSVTGNVGGNVTGSVGSIAAAGITFASFAANALRAVWDELYGAHRTPGSFGERFVTTDQLGQEADAIHRHMELMAQAKGSGTLQAATSLTATLAASDLSGADDLQGLYIRIHSGAAKGSTGFITGNTAAPNVVVTVDGWTGGTPSDTPLYSVM